MAYDSETYGQSPFGNSTKKATQKASPADASTSQAQSGSSASGTALSDNPIDDGLDFGPGELPSSPPTSSKKASTSRNSTEAYSTKAGSTKAGSTKDTLAAEKAAFAKALQTDKPLNNIPPAVGRIAGKLGLGKTFEKLTNEPSSDVASDTPKRKSRTTAKNTAKSTTSKKSSARKSGKRKQTKAEQAAQAEAEAAVARRFQEEDRSAYLSLLYKTGISMLVWAVLRLSRHELSENAIAFINIIIHPLLVAAVTIVAVAGLTFWLRRLLNDLARHTQQLSTDAEETGGKNYRPTLEIVGDSLEYNPQLRKHLALFFDVASMLICTLVSYLITSALLP